jgi:hypothetical protein
MTLWTAITLQSGKDELHWPVGAKEMAYRNVCLLAESRGDPHSIFAARCRQRNQSSPPDADRPESGTLTSC